MSFDNINEAGKSKIPLSATEAFKDHCVHCFVEGYKQGKKDALKHGHWIHGSSSENIRVTCSECGYKVNYFWDSWQDALYCPKCGARMEDFENETN